MMSNHRGPYEEEYTSATLAVKKGSVILILNRIYKVYHVNETCFLTLSGVGSLSPILVPYLSVLIFYSYLITSLFP
jgi:hypothetical protein